MSKMVDIEELINGKYEKHWAESLQVGDRCKARIRHKTDGSKNIIGADIIVIENRDKNILASFKDKEVLIPYNELIRIEADE